jgi:hypothetical protein
MIDRKNATPKINPEILYPLLNKAFRLLTVIKLDDLDHNAPILIGWLKKQLEACEREVERIRIEFDADWVSHLDE